MREVKKIKISGSEYTAKVNLFGLGGFVVAVLSICVLMYFIPEDWTRLRTIVVCSIVLIAIWSLYVFHLQLFRRYDIQRTDIETLEFLATYIAPFGWAILSIIPVFLIITNIVGP